LNEPPKHEQFVPPKRPVPPRRGSRAVIRGQDRSRWTDFYHFALTMPWWGFFAGMAGLFAAVNAVFAGLYLIDPSGIAGAKPNFWDEFLFSVKAIGSLEIGGMTPRSAYAYTLVVAEAFLGFVYVGLMTSVMFARFSRPKARVMFSRVALILPFDGVPTLMFRAANQRGNQVLDAGVTVSYARQVVTREGIEMRRFEELKLVRARTSLFNLSWTIMHRIDETSPLHGKSHEQMLGEEAELVVLLSGTDDTLADVIYARQSYAPDQIVWNRRFVDIITDTGRGRWLVDLNRFHDTEALPPYPS